MWYPAHERSTCHQVPSSRRLLGERHQQGPRRGWVTTTPRPNTEVTRLPGYLSPESWVLGLITGLTSDSYPKVCSRGDPRTTLVQRREGKKGPQKKRERERGGAPLPCSVAPTANHEARDRAGGGRVGRRVGGLRVRAADRACLVQLALPTFLNFPRPAVR